MSERLETILIDATAQQLQREHEFLASHVPEHLRDHPLAAIAARGLYVVRRLYGTPESSRSYIGEIEESPVPATYHNTRHTEDGITAYTNHVRRTNEATPGAYSEQDLLLGVADFAWHDTMMGNGRRSENPMAHDERIAAEDVQREARVRLGSDAIALALHAGVLATTYNEVIRSQDIDPSRGHLRLQHDMAATDLSGFATPNAPRNTMDWAVESLAKSGQDYLLTRVAEQRGIAVTDTASGMQVIERSDELRDGLVKELRGSAGYYLAYQYPEDWTLDDIDQRQANAAFARQLADEIETRQITASEAYQQALEYATSRN